MTVSITLEQLLAMEPCDYDARRALFGRRKKMNAKQALAAGASIKDLVWVAGRLGLKRECVTFALRFAQRVAHLNPDPRVQAALDATQAWLDNPCDGTPYASYVAAADASAASRAAAYASYAAADAASRASYAAASRAAYAAASRAAYASYAADDSAASRAPADAADAAAQLEIFLEIFG